MVGPRQNRVTPFGEIVADPMRGLFTGNRGCLHNDTGQIVRQQAVKRWIICLLDFKGRKRQIMRPGHYTELFFLDEVTALAAGHRPCAECQRDRYLAFLKATNHTRAGALDDELARARTKRPLTSPKELPNGAMITQAGQAFLRWQDNWLLWTTHGYQPAANPTGEVRLLTPEPTVKALANGYQPVVYGTSG